MSKAACAKKAICNPPVFEGAGPAMRAWIRTAESMIQQGLLTEGEIQHLIAADERYAPEREKLDAKFCERYERVCKGALKRLTDEEGVA